MPRTLILLLLAPAVALAQFDAPTRYDLGRRLRLFERALDRHNTPEAIKRAVPPLAPITPAFFSGRLGEAGRMLDTARLTLPGAKAIDPAERWAASLSIRPARRFVDVADGKLAVTVATFYKVEPAPEKATLRLGLLSGGKVVAVAPGIDLTKLPAEAVLTWKKLPEGDLTLRAEALVGTKVIALGDQTVAAGANLADRVAALKKLDRGDSLDSASRHHVAGLVADLAAGRTLEADYPGHRLLTEAEAKDRPFYTAKRTGQFWLALPGVAGSPVRVEVPEATRNGKPLPVVVALHGAGGSENLFFDGYGDGAVAKLASKRGWLVVAPRSPLLSFTGPDVPAILDALAKVYPIDAKRVFLVGHSMGAMQAVAAAGRSPGRYAAVAALGGGGNVKASDGLKTVPFLVGVGEKDFARRQAAALAASLKKAGVAKVTYREYADVEHLTIVQLALPDVFAFFDGVR